MHHWDELLNQDGDLVIEKGGYGNRRGLVTTSALVIGCTCYCSTGEAAKNDVSTVWRGKNLDRFTFGTAPGTQMVEPLPRRSQELVINKVHAYACHATDLLSA